MNSKDRAEYYRASKPMMSRKETNILEELEDRLMILLEMCGYNPRGNDWNRFTAPQEEYIDQSALNERRANMMARSCLDYIMQTKQNNLFQFLD